MPIQYDENGIAIQTLSEILDEREVALQSFLGSDFIVSGDDPIGNLQLADADRELSIQELILYLVVQMNPDTAEGIWLDFICALNNIYRNAPTYTEIPITVTGLENTVIDAGLLTIVDETTNRYYINKEYFVIGSVGTVDTTYDAIFRCTDYGEVQASSSSTYTIKTPISGITSVEYTSGGTTEIGTETETDSSLRARREEEIELRASSTLASIKAVVYEVPGVDFVQCYENDTNGTVDSIPAKAFEVVVKGGIDSDIAQAILSKKPSGIQAYGTTTIAVSDSDGNSFNIGLTRATDIPIEIEITALVSSVQTAEWETQVKNAIVSKFTSTYDVGDDIYVYPLYSALNSYSEILNITVFQMQKVSDSGLWDDTVVIAKREVGTLSIDNISITQITS